MNCQIRRKKLLKQLCIYFDVNRRDSLQQVETLAKETQDWAQAYATSIAQTNAARESSYGAGEQKAGYLSMQEIQLAYLGYLQGRQDQFADELRNAETRLESARSSAAEALLVSRAVKEKLRVVQAEIETGVSRAQYLDTAGLERGRK